MDDDETTTTENAPTEDAPTDQADAILASVYEAKISALTAENLALTAALVQAKADNYDLLIGQAGTVEATEETDPDDPDDDDDLDAVFN